MKTIGRYTLLGELARGGMASVHFGRLDGPGGFGRAVAIKRLHAHLAGDPQFTAMLLDEARLAARIQHRNVVAMLDVVREGEEVLLVMEHVDGETLQRLLAGPGGDAAAADTEPAGAPPAIASAILVEALRGLHAAHQVTDERGQPLGLVHRDVSPQNIMVRRDGTALVVDFGVAKASGRFHTTEHGTIKGKLPYMAPEQVRAGALGCHTDVYAAGAVLWEALVGRRLIAGSNDGEVIERLLFADIEAPSAHAADVSPALDAVVMRALDRDPAARFASAETMAEALVAAQPPAAPAEVAAWVEARAGERLRAQQQQLQSLLAARVTAPGNTGSTPSPHAAGDDGPHARDDEASRGAPGLDATRTGFSSVDLPAAAPPRPRSTWLVGGVVAASVVALWFVIDGRATSSETPARAEVAAAARDVARSALEAGSAAVTDTGDGAAANDAKESANGAGAAGAATSSAGAATTTAAAASGAASPGARPPAGTRRGAAGTKSKPSGKCEPYRVDAAGHRIYNLDCLP